jgi:hypothetical protein
MKENLLKIICNYQAEVRIKPLNFCFSIFFYRKQKTEDRKPEFP